MLKLIKQLFNRKNTLEQQLKLVNYLDKLQLNVLKGAINNEKKFKGLFH